MSDSKFLIHCPSRQCLESGNRLRSIEIGGEDGPERECDVYCPYCGTLLSVRLAASTLSYVKPDTCLVA
jgi:hypothetical protein